MFLAGAVASIVALATILALLAMCRSSQRGLKSAAVVQRNLSGTEDGQRLSDILEQCLDLEEEHGLRQATAAYGDEASKIKTRLVAMLYQWAADFEQMRDIGAQGLQDEAQMPPLKMPRLNEPLPSTSHPQASGKALGQDSSRAELGNAVGGSSGAGAWVATDAQLVFSEGEQQLHMAKLSNEPSLQWGISASRALSLTVHEEDEAARPPVSGGGANSDLEALMPEAWLEYPAESAYPQSAQRLTVETSLRNPTVGASGTALMTRIEQEEHAPRGFDVTWNGLEVSASTRAVQATGSDGEGPCEAGELHLHPFVRLPVVNPDDVQRSFRVQFALSFRFSRCSPMRSYTTMRSLFAKTLLTPHDVETLMEEAEQLASYAADKLTRQQGRCTANYLVTKLSSLFMVFDHLVCTIQLLGDKMNTGSWWTEFVRKFHTDYFFPETARTERTETLNTLVNRLSSALAIYKSGRRPPLREVIDLKRTILTMAYKGSQLSHPLWKLWIQDDTDFYCSSHDS